MLLQNDKYSLYHLVDQNGISLRTIKNLVDEDGLTVQDFILRKPIVDLKLGGRKSVFGKINKAIEMIPTEQYNQPCLYHLAITGLSQKNILLLQSFDINYNELKSFSLSDFYSKTENGRVSTYHRIKEAYNKFENLRNVTVLKETGIVESKINNFLDTLKIGEFFTLNQLFVAVPALILNDFKDFFKENLLYKRDIWYRRKYKELKYYLEDSLELKYRNIIVKRLQGNTLQQISDDQNVTRQAIALREKVALECIPITEEEVLYGSFFEKFNCPKDLFCCLFDVRDEIYNFLTIRLKRGKKNLITHLEDFIFTEKQKNIILNYYNLFINHKNELKRINKTDVFEDVLFHYGRSITNDSKLLPKFNEYIIAKNYNLAPLENLEQLRGLSDRCTYALRNRGHYYRYYDFEQLDKEEINQLKELLMLSPGIYSMKKIYVSHTDFLKSIDIDDEFELHNLYKTFIPIPNVDYNRMPEFAIDNIEKNSFLINLFHEQAPIQIDDFVSYINENYGLKKTSLKSHIHSFLSEYINNDIICVNYKELTNDEINYLKSLLTNDIHTITEIQQIGIKKYSDFHDKFINNMVLKELGYSIRGEFILNNSYGSIERFFIKQVLKDDYFINERLPINRTQIFGKVIYDLEKSLKLFKVEKNLYITAGKLEKSGFPKGNIVNFQDEIINFASRNKFFTLASLRKLGFTHELLNLGFENIFYERILWSDSRIKTINLATGYIFVIQNKDVSLVDFLKWLIREFKAVGCQELLDYITKHYGLTIVLQKAISLLRDTETYYSPELSRFYCDKNTYFEEIYR